MCRQKTEHAVQRVGKVLGRERCDMCLWEWVMIPGQDKVATCTNGTTAPKGASLLLEGSAVCLRARLVVDALVA